MNNWQLIEAVPMDCTMDDSGIYTVIHRKTSDQTHKGYADSRVFVRVDVMRTYDNTSVVSFIGLENDVRKNLMHWIDDNACRISTEHASYIGRELLRAVNTVNYVQE